MPIVRALKLGPPEARQSRSVVTDDGLYGVVRTLDSYGEGKQLLEQVVAAVQPEGTLTSRLARLAAIEPTPFGGYGASLLLGQVRQVGRFHVFRYAWWGDCMLHAVRDGVVAPVNRPHVSFLGDRRIWTRCFGDRLGPAQDTVPLDRVDRLVLTTGALTEAPEGSLHAVLAEPLDALPDALRSHLDAQTTTRGHGGSVVIVIDGPRPASR